MYYARNREEDQRQSIHPPTAPSFSLLLLGHIYYKQGRLEELNRRGYWKKKRGSYEGKGKKARKLQENEDQRDLDDVTKFYNSLANLSVFFKLTHSVEVWISYFRRDSVRISATPLLKCTYSLNIR